MILSIFGLLLIEGENLSEETLRGISLMNAKQLVVGSALGFGIVVQVTANSADDLGNVLLRFAEVPGVKQVFPIALRDRE